MKRALITGSGYEDQHFEQLKAAGVAYEHYSDPIDKATLHEKLPHLELYLLGGDERLGIEEFSVAKQLKRISFVGTGFEAFIDASAARAHGVEIRNTPGVAVNAVVEHTLALIIGMRRDLFAQNEGCRSGQASFGPTSELKATKIGIHGMGNIGKALAKLLADAFGCQVRYFSRTQIPGSQYEFMEKDDLLAWADITVLMLPTTSATEGYLGKAEFACMPRASMLVNTAGARLVDADALREALTSGHLSAAGFDGYFEEPPPPPSNDPFGLLGLPSGKFVMTPHTAAKTPQTWGRMVGQAVQNLVD